MAEIASAACESQQRKRPVCARNIDAGLAEPNLTEKAHLNTERICSGTGEKSTEKTPLPSIHKAGLENQSRRDCTS